MGNVWRILGIVLISMVLGLTSLFLLLFTICGGFSSSGGEGAAVVLVTGAIIVCGIAGIVWLGRGIAAARPAPAGLAVQPAYAGDAPIPGGAPVVAAPRPAVAPLARTDLQLLVFLRILLVASILFTLGSTALTFIRYQGAGFSSGLAIQLVFSSLFGVLPAIFLVLTLRNPPSGFALDAIAGMGIAGILFRAGSFAAFGYIRAGLAMPELAMYLMRLALFTLIDAALVGLAIALRRKVDTTTFARLLVTTAAFLIWEWLTQMMWRLFI
jgi:hypothetical protein